MASEAAIAASLQRPESDLDGSSSYVPSLASPTCRDSLDEGYDPDETLQVTVYDNEEGKEEIKIKSSGMYYSSGKFKKSKPRLTALKLDQLHRRVVMLGQQLC